MDKKQKELLQNICNVLNEGNEELTDKIINELVSQGWPKSDLVEFQKNGNKYNRSRNSIVFDDFKIENE